MGRKKGSTNKSKPKVTRITQKQTQKQIVHVHIEKPTKTRKKRSPNKPKEQLPIPISKNALKPGTNAGLIHMRGQINNEPLQPTIIQQIQATPDPLLAKLEKRTRKIKEYLKSKGDTKINPIDLNLLTPSNDNFTDSLETRPIPQKLDFDKLRAQRKTTIANKILSIFKSKKKEEEKPPETIHLLEYHPSLSAPATAPSYTTPKTGIEIKQQLKNLVNQLHGASPNKKIAIGPFRGQISKKLKELGVEPSHTAAYVNEMRKFYDEIYLASHEIVAAT